MHEARPADTSPEAWDEQFRLLRQATAGQRVAKAMSLSRFAVRAAKAAIRRRHPDASEDELAVLWVRHAYGAALAAGVEARLRRRSMT